MGIFEPKKMSTQDHLDIADIRDDLVVLKNGKVSLVIETTSLNFDLLDGQEQDGKIYSFAAYLNSITFPIQIVIKTQRTDIAKYLKLLDSYKRKITSEAVIRQVTMYQEFINNLTESTQILDKRFYTIIPTTKLPIVESNTMKQIFGKQEKIVNIASIVEKGKLELYPKRDAIIKQYANIGIAAKQLTNDELIKLYYSVYEPDKTGLEVLNIREQDIESGLVSSERGDI
jgi:hypothetical protein